MCGSMPMLLSIVAPVRRTWWRFGAGQIPKRVDDVAFIDTNEQQGNGARCVRQWRANMRNPCSEDRIACSWLFSVQEATIASLGDPQLTSVRL